MNALIALGALIVDQLLGELSRWHPLVGFGRLADRVEGRLNDGSDGKLKGVVALLITTLPFVLLVGVLESTWGIWVSLVVLYFALGARSLADHARAVACELERDDMGAAREKVGRMVSRESADMDRVSVIRATIESVLENGLDAIFGALFWFFIAGAPGVVFYRLVNTLDAMWGYRNERFSAFGWFTAKLDDLLNWIPARLVAASYALMGNRAQAMDCWRDQAGLLASPNGGPVMTAGAGALDIELGGPAVYQGKRVEKPLFGGDNPPDLSDIYRALDLVHKSLLLWLLMALTWSLLIA
ncbi:MAG: adenosylcobinamide-phosphate synthase CbiB [Sedimenticola sp.]